jgi:hypothetical protein
MIASCDEDISEAESGNTSHSITSTGERSIGNPGISLNPSTNVPILLHRQPFLLD